MLANIRCAAFAALASSFIIPPAQAQTAAAPLVPLSGSGAAPANGPEAGPTIKLASPTDPTPGITVQQARTQAPVGGPGAAPTIKLDTPTDSMAGITVEEARTRGILVPQERPKVAVVPRP